MICATVIAVVQCWDSGKREEIGLRLCVLYIRSSRFTSQYLRGERGERGGGGRVGFPNHNPLHCPIVILPNAPQPSSPAHIVVDGVRPSHFPTGQSHCHCFFFIFYNVFTKSTEENTLQIRNSKRGAKRSTWLFGYRLERLPGCVISLCWLTITLWECEKGGQIRSI